VIVSENKGIHPDWELMVTDWEGTWQEIREKINWGQERQQKWHDQKGQPAPEYVTREDVLHGRAKKADRVMLNRKNLLRKRPMAKLDHKMLGPFVVLRKMGSRAYEIELPDRQEIYPVFYVALMEPYREDPNRRPQKEIPTQDIVDNEPSYVVSDIVDRWWYENPKKKFPNRFVQYMVAWDGYGPEENSWEPFEMLEDTAMKALQQFHKRYPSKPRDKTVINNPNCGTKRGR